VVTGSQVRAGAAGARRVRRLPGDLSCRIRPASSLPPPGPARPPVPAATSRPGRGYPQHSGTPGFTIYETHS